MADLTDELLDQRGVRQHVRQREPHRARLSFRPVCVSTSTSSIAEK